MLVLREAIGQTLRSQRIRQGRTLRQVAADARVSLGYLSEVERGHKESSSELLAAICGALDTELSDLFAEVSLVLRRDELACAGLRFGAVTSRPPSVSADVANVRRLPSVAA
jgi:transcriptional regulator with XRE-family HTH domain